MACYEQGNREKDVLRTESKSKSREKRQRLTERYGDQKGKVGRQEEREKTEGLERNKREGGRERETTAKDRKRYT